MNATRIGPPQPCFTYINTTDWDTSMIHLPLVGGLEHVLFFPYIGNNTPN